MYALEYQQIVLDHENGKWLPLAEDLDDEEYEWNTLHVPDGRYRVRVTASDSPDNPVNMTQTTTRLSDPILVDNTPPDLGTLAQRIEGGQLWISSQVTDALSAIRAIEYSLDGESWKPALPDDLIYDSTQETFVIKMTEIDSGPHVVTIRVSDQAANTRYEAVQIEIE